MQNDKWIYSIVPTDTKKLNTVISFPHQFPGLSYPLVQNDKWIYSIVPTDSKVVKKTDYPDILILKLVEANLEKDPILKTIREAIRDKEPGPWTSLPDWGDITPNITTILLCAKTVCVWMADWPYRRICRQQC